MNLLNHTHSIFNSEADAQKAADAMADGEWEYRVSVSPVSGKAIIEVYDEDGEFISYV